MNSCDCFKCMNHMILPSPYCFYYIDICVSDIDSMIVKEIRKKNVNLRKVGILNQTRRVLLSKKTSHQWRSLS